MNANKLNVQGIAACSNDSITVTAQIHKRKMRGDFMVALRKRLSQVPTLLHLETTLDSMHQREIYRRLNRRPVRGLVKINRTKWMILRNIVRSALKKSWSRHRTGYKLDRHRFKAFWRERFR